MTFSKGSRFTETRDWRKLIIKRSWVQKRHESENRIFRKRALKATHTFYYYVFFFKLLYIVRSCTIHSLNKEYIRC